MSLTRRVTRREALPPPECLPFKLAKTLFQQHDRIQALKSQIRYPYALSDVILRRHLVANNWDVNAAAAAFRREEEVALKNDTSPADEAHYQSRRASTVGGSRLLAAADMRTQINSDREEPVELSHASLLGLLQSSRWDLKNALEEYECYKDDLSDIISQFSHLRSKDPTDIEQDERLVEFITLTSTESIASAERFLAETDWDFVRAVNGWSRLGYLPIVMSKRYQSGEEAVNRGRRAVIANRHPRNGNDEPLQATTANTYNEKVDTGEWPSDAEAEDSGVEEDNLRPTYATSKRQGFAIDIDREPARVGCPDATKLRIETISSGKYKCAWLPGKSGRKNKVFSFRWTDDEDNDEGVGAEDENEDGSGGRFDSEDLAVVAADRENAGASADDENAGASADDENMGVSGGHPDDKAVEIEFDWNNSKHITFLNNWRRQYLFRVTNQASKTKTIPFNDAEDEWLWYKQAELLEEIWDELVGRTGSAEVANNFMADSSNFPLVAKASTWRRWEREFDAKFGGHIVAVGEPPRPFRSAGSLNTHSHRVSAIITDFHLRLNKAHRKTTARASKAENEEGQGEEEDQSEEERGEEMQGVVQE